MLTHLHSQKLLSPFRENQISDGGPGEVDTKKLETKKASPESQGKKSEDKMKKSQEKYAAVKKTTERLYGGLKPKEINSKGMKEALSNAQKNLQKAQDAYEVRVHQVESYTDSKVKAIQSKLSAYTQEAYGKLIKNLGTKASLTPELSKALMAQAQADAGQKIDLAVKSIRNKDTQERVKANVKLTNAIKERNSTEDTYKVHVAAQTEMQKDIDKTAKANEEKTRNALQRQESKDLSDYTVRQQRTDTWMKGFEGKLTKIQDYRKKVANELALRKAEYNTALNSNDATKVENLSNLMVSSMKNLETVDKEIKHYKNQIDWGKKALDIRNKDQNKIGLTAQQQQDKGKINLS